MNNKQNDSPKRTMLLATFTNDQYIEKVISRIFRIFNVENDQINVYGQIEIKEEKLLSYNIILNDKKPTNIKDVYNTIRINRNRDTNTFYTINSVNHIVIEEVGEKDPSHVIDWTKYENSIVLHQENVGLKITPIKFIKQVVKDKFLETNKSPQGQYRY